MNSLPTKLEAQMRIIFGNYMITSGKFNFMDLMDNGYSIISIFSAIKCADEDELKTIGFLPGHLNNLRSLRVTTEKLKRWNQVLDDNETERIAEMFDLNCVNQRRVYDLFAWRPNTKLFPKIKHKSYTATQSRATKRPYFVNQEKKRVYIRNLESWHDFDDEIYNFDRKLVERDTQASYDCATNFLQSLANQATSQLYASVVLMHTVEKMVPLNPSKLHQFVCNYRVKKVIPDLFFSIVSNSTYLPELGLVPMDIQPLCYHAKEPLENVYTVNVDNSKTRPICQAINYMLKTNTKYSILTTFEQTWVFKRDGDKVFVSRAIELDSWLQTIFWVCCKALENVKTSPENAYQFTYKDKKHEDDDDHLPDVDGDSDTDDDQDSSDRPAPQRKCRERVECAYRSEFDTYDQDDEDESIYFISDFKKIGPGRIGAFYADMYQNDEFVRPVVLKCTDEEKCRAELKEIRNEGRVLYYAKKLGLKCTPDIYFSGSSGPYYANLIELLREDEFYTKKLKELDLQERQLFRGALIELASHGIKHNDIKSRHVFFARDHSRCVIIDYGFARIIKNKNELELEYDFDESLSHSATI